MKRLHLVKRKEVWVITVKGWLVIGVACMVMLGCFVAFVHPFFSVTDPVRGSMLVVEGWLPRYAIEQAVREFTENGYQRFVTTGGPIYSELPCNDFKTYAELAAAILQDLKVDAEKIDVVPAPDVKKDRTYVSALALKKWLHQNGRHSASLDIITLGPHARRSRMLYQMALGADASVGVISVPNRAYDPNRWYRYSEGVKTIINEVIGFIYTKFIFRPENSN